MITHSITTNAQHLKYRADFNEKCLAELKAPTLKRGHGIQCQMPDKTPGIAVPLCLADFQRPYCGCEGEVDISGCPYGTGSKRFSTYLYLVK